MTNIGQAPSKSMAQSKRLSMHPTLSCLRSANTHQSLKRLTHQSHGDIWMSFVEATPLLVVRGSQKENQNSSREVSQCLPKATPS